MEPAPFPALLQGYAMLQCDLSAPEQSRASVNGRLV